MKKTLAILLVFLFGSLLIQTPSFFAPTAQGMVLLESMDSPDDPLEDQPSDPLTQQQLTEEEEEKHSSVLPRLFSYSLSFPYSFHFSYSSLKEIAPSILLPPPELA